MERPTWDELEPGAKAIVIGFYILIGLIAFVGINLVFEILTLLSRAVTYIWHG